jgi:hypothetical protein
VPEETVEPRLLLKRPGAVAVEAAGVPLIQVDDGSVLHGCFGESLPASLCLDLHHHSDCHTEAGMDLGDLTQLAFVATTVLVLGRVGWALARLIDRRSSDPAGQAELAERVRALEDDYHSVRQELAEMQERQEFTERALLRDPTQSGPPAPVTRRDRVITPV